MKPQRIPVVWGDGLAELLEQDRVYVENMKALIRRHSSGKVDQRQFAAIRASLVEHAVKRAGKAICERIGGSV